MRVVVTEKDRNKLNYRTGPLRSDSVIKLVSDLITESDQVVRAVHSCNSWFIYFFCSFSENRGTIPGRSEGYSRGQILC